MRAGAWQRAVLRGQLCPAWPFVRAEAMVVSQTWPHRFNGVVCIHVLANTSALARWPSRSA
jgi:hypothetical protein